MTDDFLRAQIDGIERAWRNNHAGSPLYLYYRPSVGGREGAVAAASDLPGPNWRLSTGERIPWNMERLQLRTWVRDRLERLPILPAE
jgi:hypothetical protein